MHEELQCKAQDFANKKTDVLLKIHYTDTLSYTHEGASNTVGAFVLLTALQTAQTGRQTGRK